MQMVHASRELSETESRTVMDDGIVITSIYDLDNLSPWSRLRVQEDVEDVQDWITITQYFDDAGQISDTVYVYDDAAG